jgi:hypothetical protein
MLLRLQTNERIWKLLQLILEYTKKNCDVYLKKLATFSNFEFFNILALFLIPLVLRRKMKEF